MKKIIGIALLVLAFATTNKVYAGDFAGNAGFMPQGAMIDQMNPCHRVHEHLDAINSCPEGEQCARFPAITLDIVEVANPEREGETLKRCRIRNTVGGDPAQFPYTGYLWGWPGGRLPGSRLTDVHMSGNLWDGSSEGHISYLVEDNDTFLSYNYLAYFFQAEENGEILSTARVTFQSITEGPARLDDPAEGRVLPEGIVGGIAGILPEADAGDQGEDDDGGLRIPNLGWEIPANLRDAMNAVQQAEANLPNVGNAAPPAGQPLNVAGLLRVEVNPNAGGGCSLGGGGTAPFQIFAIAFGFLGITLARLRRKLK